jgi:type II secretory pathway component PulC
VLLLAAGGFGLALADSVRAQEASTTKAPTTGVLRARGKSARIIEVDRRSQHQTFDAPLPVEMEAGVISRAALQAVLASGIGKFLQQVRAEPSVTRGRFIGWRMVSLFPDRSDVHVQVLRPGDTVVRVNGQSIERPEQFKALWDAMANATELVLDIQREGRSSRLRYTIEG